MFWIKNKSDYNDRWNIIQKGYKTGKNDIKQVMIWKYKLYSVNVCNNSIIWDIMGQNDRLKCDMI